MKWIRENKIILLLIISQIVLMGFIIQFGGELTTIQWLMVAGIMLLGIVIDVWVYMSFAKIKEKERLEQQLETMRKEQQYEKESLLASQNSLLQMEAKRRDFYQSLEVLYQKCESGASSEQIKEAYMDTSQCLSNMRIVKYCESPIVNAILTSKQEEAQKEQIDMKVAIDELTDDMGIERIDMCSVFCNLLDNAIEACRKVDVERFVYVRTQNKGGYLSIVVENSSKGKLVKGEKGFLTSKLDVTEHGYGTKILSMIAEKYDGRFYLDEEAGKVKAVVLLRISQQ